MTIEHATARMNCKPWGSRDLLPWSTTSANEGAIGELWFQREGVGVPDSVLLLKILFTTEPLSIQVHPDDDFARSIGLKNGKTEAWYILSANPGAQVAVGLKYPISSAELRTAIADGSIAELVQWRSARKGDVIFVPAGTIHTIGAGIVLAEVQQRSDATFRLFDYERQRELHTENAIAASYARPAPYQSPPTKINEGRTALIVSSHFVLEKIDCLPNSSWTLDVKRETWILVLRGRAQIGITNASLGDAIFMEADRAEMEVGSEGMQGLVTYPGPDPEPGLLTEATNSAGNSGSSRAPSLQVATPEMLLDTQEART
jgi:mannose-6-phosphate isomerase